MSSCSAAAPKEKKFGIKVCRERKCPDLQRNPEYPDSLERCIVTHGMPGAMSMCVKEMSDEQFILQISSSLNLSNYSAPRPGIKNCPEICPYKLVAMVDNGKGRKIKEGHCALTGALLGTYGVCPCNILGNPRQEDQIKRLKLIVYARQKNTNPTIGLCNMGICPDGKNRGGPSTLDDLCPVIRLPYDEINIGMGCPLWRIPAKLLPKPQDEIPADPSVRALDVVPDIKKEQEKPTKTGKPAGTEDTKIPEKKRKKKEPEDPICDSCRERFGKPVPDYACEGCKEEQQKYGRRFFLSDLTLKTVHLGDMNELGDQIPANSIDLIFTDPAYVKDQYQQAYADLAELALRVLKPNGFLITYAPQTHLDEIMDMLRYNGTWLHGGKLQYFWIIESLNKGQSTAKNHQRNAICLHKPILVFQKAHEGEPLKGSRRCFADVVWGRRQKKFHPWQQSVHDVLGIISRFMVPGEILLDPYAGTGTSLIAANLLGMDWIGFEINPETHAIAVRELQQQPLSLEAFGIGAPETECERVPAEVPKDTSKQFVIAGPFTEFKETIKESRELCNDAATLQEPDDPAKEVRPVELSSTCLECEALDKCTRKDPYGGCLDAVKAIEEAAEEKKKTQNCDTCKGGHENPNVITMDCPDYPDVSSGKIDQEKLREDTRRLGCGNWSAPGSESKIPNVWEYCVGERGCESISSVDGICTKTGQKVKEMTYCPTQHLVGMGATR